ncbi:TniQ family protein [Pseudotabrizicola sp.]|uniref:TniQ family protein n=1 Tax=Pseudotabrizicola sp. TaxID=2939647 RepID=UPI0027317D12|nr:TniQ family protein [Pseudotabrizicola sp.]MDP2079528.1 TniQ family protein [Pseudotabrizicola sp.]
MPLLPKLPVLAGESLSSYMQRASKFHARQHLYTFLETLEIPRGAVMSPRAGDLARIGTIFALEVDELAAMTFESFGGRKRRIAGEDVHAEFANLDKTTYCPACLLDDAKPDSASAGMRVGRISWNIDYVRTCPTHGIALVRHKNKKLSDRLQLMSEVAPDNEALRALVSTASPQLVSDLQAYIQDRLGRKVGPAWLDTQPIDTAARACEKLGVILTAGTHVNLNQTTQQDLNLAGHVGFRYASRGEAGVQAALREALDRFAKTGDKGGPQKAFGRLYQWLQFDKNGKEPGPISEVVRDFILDHFPVAVGTDLFGKVVDRQRVHSVHTLAEKTGELSRTVHRAVVLSGLIEGDPEKPNAFATFDLQAGEDLIRRIQNSISVTKLREHLNCNRVQAEQFVRTGLIPILARDKDTAVGFLKNVAIEDADAFLSRLVERAQVVTSPSQGMMEIVAAAEAARWPVLDIVNGILAGLISNVQVVDQSLKFKGIVVDPVEVKEVLAREKSCGHVSTVEAARLLNLSVSNLSFLGQLTDTDGKPYLQKHFVENSKGAKIRIYSTEDIATFLRNHISLKEYAESLMFSSKVMRKKLDCRGIKPITESYSLGRLYYRKADLAA